MRGIIKNIVRVAYVAIIIAMVVATVVNKISAPEIGGETIYSSWWFIGLWVILGVAGMTYIIRKHLYRRPTVFAIHASLFFILIGAAHTHLTGIQGIAHIRVGETIYMFCSEDGSTQMLPFGVTLNEFDIVNYPGTDTPMDYVSHLAFTTSEGKECAEVSMNNIASNCGYRFYQSSYDEDGRGTVLSVSHDPAGIGITYVGYGLLFASLFLMLVLPNCSFRKSIRKLKSRSAFCIAALLAIFTIPAQAAEVNISFPEKTADKFGDLYAYYNGRICPLQTVARDFTLKLYGRDRYMGYTAEQVLMGWTLNPPEWANTKMIRIKESAAEELGLDGTLVSYDDLCHSPLADKMDQIRHGSENASARALEEAEEKSGIIKMLFAGQMLKVFPVADTVGAVTWYSPADALPDELPEGQRSFIGNIFTSVVSQSQNGNFAQVDTLLTMVRGYQLLANKINCEDGKPSFLPSSGQFKAEKAYNSMSFTRPLAMTMATVGILFFFVVVWLWSRGVTSRAMTMFSNTLVIFLGIIGLYLATMFALRWYVGGHLPLSNGNETMLFMSLCVIVVTLFTSRKFALAMPFGYLLGGLSLMVSMFGEGNPQVTNLIPVLASPLLSIHVCLVMVAYSLLAFTALDGIAAIVVHLTAKDEEMKKNRIGTLADVSRVLIYPALACLAAGIFVGAIWANQSWGRYWGWDPKEVWALITLMVYAIAVHPSLAPRMRNEMTFHIYVAAAFLCVLMTYFGVNFLLGGMHSYA